MVAGSRAGLVGRLLGRWIVAALVLGLVGAPAASAKRRAAPAPARADLTVRSAAATLDTSGVRVALVAANAGRRRAPASTGMVRWTPAGGLVVTVLRRFRVPALARGARRGLVVVLPVPAGASGAFAVSVCLDVRAEVRERRRGNNCRAAGRVTVPSSAALGEVRTSLGTTITPPAVAAPLPGGPPAGEPPADGVPETAIARGPVGTTNARTATFLFSALPAGATFACRLDGADWAPCTVPAVYPGLADGVHTFEVRATGAGGTDATPASRSWTVDGTPPDTTITAGPPVRDGATSASLEFAASEPDATFSCRIDGGSWTFCTSPRDLTGLTEGAHTIQVRATDTAGNTDPTPASRTWTVDVTGPQTTIGSGPSNVVTGPAAAFTFTSEAGASFACRLDAGPWEACASPAAYTDLTDGPHTFEVRATDSVGNVDPTPASRAWTVDALAPETTIDAGPTGTVATADADLAFSSPDADATFECRLDGGAWAACSAPVSLTGLADGPHTFEVRAVDAVGNADPTPAAQDWTVAVGP